MIIRILHAIVSLNGSLYLLCCTVILLSLGCQTDFDKGMGQLRNGKTKEAVEYLEKVSSSDKDYSKAQSLITLIRDSILTRLGDSLYWQHNYKFAMDAYSKVKNPDSITIVRLFVCNRMASFDTLDDYFDKYQYLWTFFSSFSNQTLKKRKSKSTSFIPLSLVRSRQRFLDALPYPWWSPNWGLFNIYLFIGDEAYCRNLYTESICNRPGDYFFHSWGSGYYWMNNEFLVMNNYEINGVWQTAYLFSDVAIPHKKRRYFLVYYDGPTNIKQTNGDILKTSHFEIIASLGFDYSIRYSIGGTPQIDQETIQNIDLLLSNSLNSHLEKILTRENTKHYAATSDNNNNVK